MKLWTVSGKDVKILKNIGKKFGKLTILSLDRKDKNNKKYYLCECECGNQKVIRSDSLTSGKTTSCGCHSKEVLKSRKGEKLKDITGERYGRLVALYRSHQKNYMSYWMCRCDCGNEKIVALNQLTTGKTKSCGCLNRDLSSERMKGENHPFWGVKGEKHFKWNPNLTNEERESKRDTVENYHFKNKVYERDNYICQCCGERGVVLNAHHIYGYSEYKELRADIDNGISLCEDCHKDYHKQYGYKNNNWEDFRTFLFNKWKETNNLFYVKTMEDIDLRLQSKELKSA